MVPEAVRCHYCAPTRTNVAALPCLRPGRLRLGPGDVRAVGRRWSAFQTQQGRHSLWQSRSVSLLAYKECLSFSVLWINEILVRIRIRGSIPLTNGSGSCSFRQLPSRCSQKIFFLYFLYLHHFSKIKSHKEVTKHLTNVFGPSGSISQRSRSGRPENIHMDPADPDPQHWSFYWLCIRTNYLIFSVNISRFFGRLLSFFTYKVPKFLEAASNESSFYLRFCYRYRTISLKGLILSPKWSDLFQEYPYKGIILGLQLNTVPFSSFCEMKFF
jgi:hypothetical protein